MNVPPPQTDTQPNTNTDEPLQWDIAMEKGTVTSAELSIREITDREMIIGGFCREGDLGFIFAKRGVGKSWLGMYLAKCIALGQKAQKWDVPKPRKVLYLDGEMNASEIKARDLVLGLPTDQLAYTNHEILFEETGRIMNLANKDFQESLLAYCIKSEVKVVVLDNLSTLTSGVDENDGLQWEEIQPFLMRLRRNLITVIFIHHAGRNNEMRGHSKREDPSAWIIRLDLPSDALEESEGAHFFSRFTKWRNASKQPGALEWMFRPDGKGGVDIKVDAASGLDIMRQLIESGVDTNKEIAVAMDVSTAYVSQMAKRAADEGWLEIAGKKYKIIAGKRHYSVHKDP